MTGKRAAHRLVGARIGHGIAGKLASTSERLFLAPLCGLQDGPLKSAVQLMSTAGVELEEVVHIRGDGRGVFVVTHPEHGKVMFKTSDGVKAASAGISNLHIARIVQASDASIFPRVYEATAGYTIEERISGLPFREWMEGNKFSRQVLQTFLMDLKAWGRHSCPWPDAGPLAPHEIRGIVGYYVRKCIRQNVYGGPRRRVMSLYRLLTARRELLRDIEWLAAEADRIYLPRGRMCGDMSNVNLMFDEGRRRLFNIDYEFMAPGNTAFDSAYLLTSMAKLPTNESTLGVLEEMIHSEEYAGSAAAAEFFSVYARVLTRISRIVYGR